MNGTLYIVATPIGNLSDISARALETLGSVQLILAEDTRVTSRLLARYGITTPLTSYQAHSSEAKEAAIIEQLQSGAQIALVSDAGTPAIQDPGGRLVALAHQDKIKVVAIPGPSAVTHALSAAGFPADSFYFAGFLPQKKGRQTALRELPEKTTVVLFESGPRFQKLLTELEERFGPKRGLWIGRELTKLYEETLRGTVAEVRALTEAKTPRGEYTLVVGPK